MIELARQWRRYKAAVRAMLDAPHPLDWPADPVRDNVQAQGMAFCALWKANGKTIAAMVAADRALFPEFIDEDPTEYRHYPVIMQRLFVE